MPDIIVRKLLAIAMVREIFFPPFVTKATFFISICFLAAGASDILFSGFCKKQSG